jgi:hypothetical protein
VAVYFLQYQCPTKIGRINLILYSILHSIFITSTSHQQKYWQNVLCFDNPLCILYLQYISIQITHISMLNSHHVVGGYYVKQCSSRNYSSWSVTVKDLHPEFDGINAKLRQTWSNHVCVFDTKTGMVSMRL